MNQYVEKLLWMIVPLLLSAATYQWTLIQTLQARIQELDAKMSLVVSKDNKVIPSIESELARERLRQDVLKYASENRERIVIIEEKIRTLNSKNK
jgi:hypothetical protein